MGKSTKAAPWLNLTTGLLFLASVARDMWAPGFLSISRPHSSGAEMLVTLICAVLFLGVACRDFMRMRPAPAR